MEFRHLSETAISSEKAQQAWLNYLSKATQRMRRGPYGLHSIFLPKRGHQTPKGISQLLTERQEKECSGPLGLVVIAGRLKSKKWAGPVIIYKAGNNPSLSFNSDWIGQVLALEAAVIGDISEKINTLKELQKSLQRLLEKQNVFALEDELWLKIIPKLKAMFMVLQGVEISEKAFLYLHEIARYNKNLSHLTDGVIADSVFEGNGCFLKGIMQLPEEQVEPLPIVDSEILEPDKELVEEIQLLSAGGVLDRYQKRAALSAIKENIAYIQGPPGTGKTRTAAVMALAALLCRKKIAFVSSKKSAGRALVERLSQILGLNAEAEFPALLGFKVSDTIFERSGAKEIIQSEIDLRASFIADLRIKKKVKHLLNSKNRLERIISDIEKQIPAGIRPIGLKPAELIYGLIKRKAVTKSEAIFINKVVTSLNLSGGDDKGLKLRILKFHCFQIITAQKLKFIDENLAFLPDLASITARVSQKKKEWKKAYNLRTIARLTELETELRLALLQGTNPHIGCEIKSLNTIKAADYDLILADEATDIDLYQGLLLASKTNRLVLFGDHKQLGIEGLGLQSGLGRELDLWLWSEHEVENDDNWPRISKTSFIDWIRKDPLINHSFLRNHYRCRKEIAQSLSAMFYEGLIYPLNVREYPFPALEFQKYEGTRNPGNALVPEEATALLNLWESKIKSPDFEIGSYGFLTYSKAQKALIMARAKKRGLPLPYLGTVEEWRGLEIKELWVSPSVGELPISGPFHSPKRMTVIISRASEKVVWFENSQRQPWPLLDRWLNQLKKNQAAT